jgi:hypothetical protein
VEQVAIKQKLNASTSTIRNISAIKLKWIAVHRLKWTLANMKKLKHMSVSTKRQNSIGFENNVKAAIQVAVFYWSKAIF